MMCLSWTVIRLVQSFKNFKLAMGDHPESLPPPEWKASGVGRKAVEKVDLRAHLTIYAKSGLLTLFSLRMGYGLRWMRNARSGQLLF